MKKTSKILAIVLAALLVVAAVVVLAACDDPKEPAKDPVVTTGAAYGYVHTNGVGKATITLTDGKITNATLDEACVPTQVAATAEDYAEGENADYVVEVVGTSSNSYYWKTVKWGSVTATYDADAKAYKVGDKLLINKGAADSYFALNDEGAANARIYFEAVANNKVLVVTGKNGNREVTNATIMTAETLLKSKNGYWDDATKYPLGWKGNVAATLAYVLEHGLDSEFHKVHDEATDKDVGPWLDSNDVSTGATWNDMANYYNILKEAKNNAAAYANLSSEEQVVTGEIKEENVRGTTKYQAKVKVTVKGGVITAIEILDLDTDYVWSSNNNYGDEDSIQAWVNENIVGKNVATVLAWTVDSGAQGGNALIDGEVFGFTKEGAEKATSATETGARVIAAIQNALSKLA